MTASRRRCDNFSPYGMIFVGSTASLAESIFLYYRSHGSILIYLDGSPCLHTHKGSLLWAGEALASLSSVRPEYYLFAPRSDLFLAR